MRFEELGLSREGIRDMLSYYCPQFEDIEEYDEGQNKIVLVANDKSLDNRVAIAHGKFVKPDEYSDEFAQLQVLGQGLTLGPSESTMPEEMVQEIRDSPLFRMLYRGSPFYVPKPINYIEIDPERGVVQDEAKHLFAADDSGYRLSFIVMEFLNDFQHIDKFIEGEVGKDSFARVELEKEVAALEGYATGYVLGATRLYTGDPNSGNILLKRGTRYTLDGEGNAIASGPGKIELKFVDFCHFTELEREEVLRIMMGSKTAGEVENTFFDDTYKRTELLPEGNREVWRMNLVAGIDHGMHVNMPIK